MQYHLTSAMLLASTLTLVTASPVEQIQARDVIGTLPAGASDIELKFQPAVDFDKDGCYPTSAVDAQGNLNPGLNHKQGCPESRCRDPAQLNNLNVYSRSRCNNGFCGIMYEYYFEKDANVCGIGSVGHTHEWENIIVFTKDDQVVRVSPSTHGKHTNGRNDARFLDGTHPKLVYHKEGTFGSHNYRHANEGDERIENPTGNWVLGPLVGFSNWPSGDIRTKVLDGKSWSGDGGIRPKLSDADFAFNLREAAGDQVPGFNPDADA
ncbi:necrosis inducing protein [Cladorrhinum sp. PSN332]|nr:necrosis inducing protein [Cladorrhinum sp. PSN332]